MKWILAPLATLVAVAVAYIIYADERIKTANPLKPWFDDEDEFIAHLPHPWSVTPPEWN